MAGLDPDPPGPTLSLVGTWIFDATWPVLLAAGVSSLFVATRSEARAGKAIRALLSLRVWTPVAHLSYSIYLVSPIIIHICYSTLIPRYGSSSLMFAICAIIITEATLLASALLYLLVERPLMNLRR